MILGLDGGWLGHLDGGCAEGRGESRRVDSRRRPASMQPPWLGQAHCPPTSLTSLSLDILHNLFIITDSVVDLNLHWTQFIITSITFIRICLRNIIFLLVTNLMVVSHGGR